VQVDRLRPLRQPPGQGMLAPTRADEEYAHRRLGGAPARSRAVPAEP
jgi:hypothetical protein